MYAGDIAEKKNRCLTVAIGDAIGYYSGQ